jgi:mono/diheme cytochrome c family protein
MPKLCRFLIFAVIIVIFLGHCNSYTPKATSPTQAGAATSIGQPGYLVPTYEYVKAQVFQPYCLSCHSSAGGNPKGVNFETYSSTIRNLEGAETEAITDKTMPPSKAIPQEAQDLLKQWIDGGAPLNGVIATPNPTPNPSGTQSNWQSIFTNVFRPKCISCHSGTKPKAKIDLTNQAWIINLANGVIVPGNPNASLLVKALKGIGGATKMPPGSSSIPAADFNAIQAWIKNGANN